MRRTTFRVNRLKSDIKYIESVLDKNNIRYEHNDEYPDAFILMPNMEKNIQALDIYNEGKIYMQSLSSMKPVYVLSPIASENILDMCAAPGSKTTMIQSITDNKVNLTACELHKDRYERLRYNCELQGANVYLLNQNAIDLSDMLRFDKILLDAPCTGTGTIDDGDDKSYITDKFIEKCVRTQKSLIKKSKSILKKGGTFVYSTCSILKEENEDMVDYAKSIGYKLIDDIIKIEPDDLYEGFFIARFLLE